MELRGTQPPEQDTRALALKNDRPEPSDDSKLPQMSVQHANKWAVMAVTAIGVFMTALDSSIVNISLPTIASSFNVPLGGAVEWVIIAYLVSTAAILLTAGRLADMIGRKVIWLAGLVLFTGSSALRG